MAEEWNETWTMNPFSGLLSDAVVFDILANNNSGLDFPDRNRYAKASVTNAVLAIEAGANSCLARITYPEIVKEQLDKLPVIDKYDVLYTARFDKKIDRGCKSFQVIRELFRLRNRYVHPKLEKIKTKIKLNENGDKTYEPCEEHQTITPVLKIPFNFNVWTGEHSRIVVAETIKFFNYFFSELCKLSVKESSELLSVYVKGPENNATFLADHEIDTLKKSKELYGQDIMFLVVKT